MSLKVKVSGLKLFRFVAAGGKTIAEARYSFLLLHVSLLLFPLSDASGVEPTLMHAGKYAFGVGDFEYVYRKNNLTGKQTLEECLSLYIPYKLKVIAAKDAGLDTLPALVEEWTMYCDRLADKYLTDAIVNEQLLREAYDRGLSEIKAAHIFVKISDSDTLPAYQKIAQIRQQAAGGEDFEQLAERYSDDPAAKTTGGRWSGYFSVFQSEYPFETAAYHTSVGRISDPARTRNGYHIIKIYDRRARAQTKSFEESKPELRQKIVTNGRMSAGIDRYVAELKKEYRFVEDTSSLNFIFEKKRYTNFGNRVLFSFAGRSYGSEDFEQYATATNRAGKISRAAIERTYKEFVAKTLFDYEKEQLKSDNEDFRDIVDEYFEGLLLFEISERESGAKATHDSAGLAEFYKKNAKSYRWKRRMVATVYSCADENTAKRAERAVNNKNIAGGRLPNDLYNFFCSPAESGPCIDTVRLILPKGTGTIADRVIRKKGCSKIWNHAGKFVFLDVHETLRPRRKTFEEARPEAIADYRALLENRWIEQLKKEYPVTIDETVWANLKKKYAE